MPKTSPSLEDSVQILSTRQGRDEAGRLALRFLYTAKDESYPAPMRRECAEHAVLNFLRAGMRYCARDTAERFQLHPPNMPTGMTRRERRAWRIANDVAVSD